jgi:hypothetical protein
VDHLVIPLDRNHTESLIELVRSVAAAVGEVEFDAPEPHITLVAHTGLAADAARQAVAPVIAGTRRFSVHAHGYGFFTGSEASALSLHVPVTRTPPLDELHRRTCAALRHAGADVAPWSVPARWSPHITLLDRHLDAERLGRAAAWLAARRHTSWEIPVDRVALVGGWPERDRSGEVMRFGP